MSEDNDRNDSERGLRGSEAGQRPADQILADELNEARRDYCLAMHQAWIDATQACWKAYAEFAAAQHRTALDAGLRRAAAYQAWFRSTHEARPQADGGLLSQPHETYHRTLEEVARTEWSEWDQAQQAYRLVLSEVNKAHVIASQDSLKAYLAQIQAIWGRADIASVDAAGLAHLARASSHAAQAAQAMQWVQR